MGTAYTVVPNYEHKQINDHLKDLGWCEAQPTDKFREFKVELIKAKDFDTIQDEFYKEVHDKTTQTEDKNFFVFVHGYKNTFQSALGTAGRLAYYAERPLILYSWPSAARLRAYNTDENNVEWSQEHFNDVLRKIEQMCTDDPSTKVRLFAHSMGSRLVVRAIPLLREKHYVMECSLICPDIDDGLVKHYARRYLSVNGTTKIRLYMSTRDKALAISQFVHGGYTRLGEQADAIGDWITKTVSGEKMEKASENSKEAEAEFQQRLEKTKDRMQTIDFTSIDKGLIGHNVPAGLITSMSFTETPGPGLHFLSEQSGKRGKMSNLFTRLSKLNKLDGNSVLSGAVLKVVKDSTDDKHAKSDNKSTATK
jgi:esterase/lipase superfamily enzyme